ncbi:hypothetical protein IE53DRAFT_373515 [Violaceomyces palustris]|uniref:Uncharacterized protein n=1 Tax=Violaceomyces palustris TaxID=1673888 RepID=A0ACD0P384_9BASI|nr:hypothetical protein IE53DRAFT_373515 [Violaceomyces palustris]
MAKRTAPQTSNGPAFPPLGLVAGVGASAASSMTGSNMNPLLGGATPTSNNNNSDFQILSNIGLPPAPTKFDASQAQQCRLQDAYWSDEEEDMDCPLCLEEIDLSDANFKPCPCGYQICRFCWHHIKQNLNGRCPACRRKYSDQTVEFKPMTPDEIKKLTQAKKQKEREKKELEAMNRKHLANMRVVQKNLVYVVGLSSKLAKEELIPTLRSNDYFGQYGRISKILISKRTTASKLVMGTSESAIGVYVTYFRKEDAARAIVAIDGSKGSDGRIIRASYGTTKYCTTYLRNLPCTNPGCTYLHEPGEEADSFTKEDLSTLRHAAKDTEHKVKPASLGISAVPKRPDSVGGADGQEASALPKTASWASGKPAGPIAPAPMVSTPFRDSELPPLSVNAASAMTRKPSSQKMPKASPIKQASASTKSTRVTSSSNLSASAVTGRPESPAPHVLSKAGSVAGESAPPSPLVAKAETQTPTDESSKSLGLESKSKSVAKESSGEMEDPLEEAKGEAVNAAGSPGFVKGAPPPGLPSPGKAATPPSDADKDVSSSATNLTSTYQPSSSAQALLDDMRQRREAEPEQPQPSPFPDFDDALSSFKDGEFSFNFPLANEGRGGSNDSSEVSGPRGGVADVFSAFQNFSPFGAPPGFLTAAHPGLTTAGTPPPGIMRTPNRSATASPSPFSGSYSGSFDPFAPGAGETIREDSSSSRAAVSNAAPFAAIEQMRRTLSEERGSSDDGQDVSDALKKASRFGFAKRKESDSFGTGFTSSPLRAELLSSFGNGGNVEPPASFSKDVSGILGNVFEQESHHQPGVINGFGSETGHTGFGLPAPQGVYSGVAMSRPPGISGPAFGSRFGTNTPPPGIAAPVNRQQQALLASLHQMGGSNSTVQSEALPHLNGSGVSFLAELQQQAQQRAQQQAQQGQGQFGSTNHGSPAIEHARHSGSSSGSTDPLLAQILAASGRRSGFGQHVGQGREGFVGSTSANDLPFDPAIMSMTRSQIQQAQAAQAAQHQFSQGGRGGFDGYAASSGLMGHGNGAGGTTFSPFDNQIGSGPQGFADHRFLHQQGPQQQGQQQSGQQGGHQDHRSPYSTLS